MIDTIKMTGLEGGMTAYRMMWQYGIEIPLYRYNDYTITLVNDYDNYKFYGKDNLPIGTFGTLIDATEALVIYGDNLNTLDEKAHERAHALFDYLIDLVFEIRGE